MGATAYILAGTIGLILIAGLVFGLASRRRSLPCPVWLRWMVELDNPFARTNRAAVIVEHLEVTPGMTVLDLGCGPGRVTVPLARAVGQTGQVVAVDLQKGMLQRASEKTEQAELRNVQFIHAGAGEGQLGSNRFDRAVLVTVLGEIPDQAAALKEIHEALKEGGILSITEIIFDPHFQKRQKVKKLAGQAGFNVKALHGNWAAYTVNLEKTAATLHS